MSRILAIADDFGLHASINEAVRLAVEAGRLQGTSVITHAPAVDWDRIRALRAAGARVGVHLAWVGLPWMSDGRLYAGWSALLADLLKGKVGARDLWKEGHLQIGQMVLHGLTPDHLDSHQHVHVLPGAWGATRALAVEFRIPRMRIPWVPSRRLVRPSAGGVFLQGMTRFRRLQLPATLPCVGIRLSGRYTLEEMERDLAAAGTADVEMVTHPGLDDRALTRLFPDWGYRWEDEFAMLMNPRWDDTMEKHGRMPFAKAAVVASQNGSEA